MKAVRAIIYSLLFLLWAGIAAAQAPSYPTTWYWIVGDTTPTTTVWNGATGAMVSNSDATYQAWVGALTAAGPGYFTRITGSASAAGLCRMTVVNSSFLTASGNAFAVVNGTGTACDGTWQTNVIDSTHVDLIGSSFSGAASTGVLGQGTPISTMAALLAFINQTNALNINTPTYYSVTVLTPLGNVNLTNPLTAITKITATTNPVNLRVPQMNLFGSIPIGLRFTITNDIASTQQVGIAYADGSPLNITLLPGQGVDLALEFNTSPNGIVAPFAYSGIPALLTNVGGTGTDGVGAYFANYGTLIYNPSPFGGPPSFQTTQTAGTRGQIYLQGDNVGLGFAPFWTSVNTTHGNSDYQIQGTDRAVITTATLTAPRTWLLPINSTVGTSVEPGHRVVISDLAGAINGANTLTVSANGGTLNGVSNGTLVLSAAFAGGEFIADGSGGWRSVPINSTQIPPASLTVGSTTISAGTTTRVLFDNAGLLGEYIVGYGHAVASGSLNVPLIASSSHWHNGGL